MTSEAPAPEAPAPEAPAPEAPAPKPPAAAAPVTTSAQVVAATLPFPIDVAIGDHRQVVTVTAQSSGSTSGTLAAWQRDDADSWTEVFGPVKAYLGADGVGHASESVSRTPAGTFALTQAFGVAPDPGSRLPYDQVGLSDWWVSDVDSPLYNTLQHCATAACPFNTAASEQLGTITTEYRYAVVIDYNRSPAVAGAGSAFFLHVSSGKPTAGCVSIPATTLVPLMQWLDPAQSPIIAIGVG